MTVVVVASAAAEVAAAAAAMAVTTPIDIVDTSEIMNVGTMIVPTIEVAMTEVTTEEATEKTADMRTATTLETPIEEDMSAVNVMITMVESDTPDVKTVIDMEPVRRAAGTIAIDTTVKANVVPRENEKLPPEVPVTANPLPVLKPEMRMEVRETTC